MQVMQRRFRTLMLISVPPAVTALLVWLSQTPVQPFSGFVLLPAVVLGALAAGSWIDGKLARSSVCPLNLTCGDAAIVAPHLTNTGEDYRSVAWRSATSVALPNRVL